MNSDPNFHFVERSVSDTEALDALQQSQRHSGNFGAVHVPIPDGKAGHDHVSIANGLNLKAAKNKRES